MEEDKKILKRAPALDKETLSNCGYNYQGRMLELVQGYNAVARILWPKFPYYIFPGYLQYALYWNYMKYFKGKFRLIPMPNLLYDLLLENEFIKSEHYIFSNYDIYYEYAISEEVNFVNLILPSSEHNAKQSKDEQLEDSKAVLKQMLSTGPHTIVAQILPLAEGGESNCLFVKENLYANLLDKLCLSTKQENHTPLWVTLDVLNDNQKMPKIATRADIYVLPTAYELPTEALDIILENYFMTPRLLHCGHTYRIELNADLVGSAAYAKYFLIFAYLHEIFIRCVKLEIKINEYEIFAVVVKNRTSLMQVPHTFQFLPRKLLHNHAILQNYPLGLRDTYQLLRQSVNTFLPKKSTCLSSKEIYPLFLVQGPRGSGKSKLIQAVAQDLGMHLFGINCVEIVSEVASHTEMKLKAVFDKINICQPLLICFHNFDIFGINDEGKEDLRLLGAVQLHIEELYKINRKYPIVVAALIAEPELKPMIRRLFLDVVQIPIPDVEQRYATLCWLHINEIFKQKLFNRESASDWDKLPEVPLFSLHSLTRFLPQLCSHWPNIKLVLRKVAEMSDGFILGDLEALHEKAVFKCTDMKLTFEHFEKHLTEMQKAFAESLGAPKVPKVLWSDIGGLAKLKEEIQDSIGMPLKYMHLMGSHLRRSGVLLYGPPGTGKTLVAKAVATECNLNFLSVQGPELLNMYVGQSEKNVREVFQRARCAAPCVLFLDELDSLAPNRGASGDSGGVMDRVVSQLLAEMDCLFDGGHKPIFILAATNRPDLIDPSLLRPGRFDKMFYVGPCSTTEDKASVLRAQTRKFNLAENFSIEEIAASLRGEMSGADLYSICSNAWLAAVRRLIDKHKKGLVGDDEMKASKVIVEMDDFKQSFKKFIPSISKTDLDYFKKLKNSYARE